MVIRRIKDRVRERLGVFVSEVGSSEVKDTWQRAELGVAIASGDRQKALAVIDDVIRVAMSAGGNEVAAVAKGVTTFDEHSESMGGKAPREIDAPAAPVAVVDDRTGSGDKAAAGDDWVPDAWREED